MSSYTGRYFHRHTDHSRLCHRRPVSGGTSRYSCSAQDSFKRDAVHLLIRLSLSHTHTLKIVSYLHLKLSRFTKILTREDLKNVSRMRAEHTRQFHYWPERNFVTVYARTGGQHPFCRRTLNVSKDNSMSLNCA